MPISYHCFVMVHSEAAVLRAVECCDRDCLAVYGSWHSCPDAPVRLGRDEHRVNRSRPHQPRTFPLRSERVIPCTLCCHVRFQRGPSPSRLMWPFQRDLVRGWILGPCAATHAQLDYRLMLHQEVVTQEQQPPFAYHLGRHALVHCTVQLDVHLRPSNEVQRLARNAVNLAWLPVIGRHPSRAPCWLPPPSHARSLPHPPHPRTIPHRRRHAPLHSLPCSFCWPTVALCLSHCPRLRLDSHHCRHAPLHSLPCSFWWPAVALCLSHCPLPTASPLPPRPRS
mmetsp:Transcript_38355/g.65811  ORF Transcript_38355/g.65811 Transcript_38355/m.65811 type:complete len:281 (-) Transcript_38355:593-1435(-)